MLDRTKSQALPAAPGVGYKAQHYTALTTDPGCVGWLEIHAENYMGQGGRPLAQLRALRERFPVSVHGVGLSIGGPDPLDADHLARLRDLCHWLDPHSFSEHLAWSTHDGAYLNDLLPLPYTDATLARVCDHVDEVQEVLGRQMLLENPSSYLAFDESTWDEVGFLAEISRRTGCGLLLDVNNVFVSAVNLRLDPRAYIEAFPLEAVGEIHLGGHDEDADDHGAPLLIDSHGRAVADPVWALLDLTLARGGPKPVLIEWDTDVPDWPVLEAEAARAARALDRMTTGIAAAPTTGIKTGVRT
ncbi:MNIO family bufferin maturase [Pseudooceanicola sp. 502str34]